MPKFFAEMPPHLEQYNPEEIFFDETNINKIYEDDFEILKTFDENGLLHSYNDVPSLSKRDDYYKIFQWHSHGEPYRENGNPVQVAFSDNSYVTHNEEDLLHSYNDNPSSIVFESNSFISLAWHSHYYTHRENNLPAVIIWEKKTSDMHAPTYTTEESYYVNGERHRGHGKPAKVNPMNPVWMVRGVPHNATSYSATYQTYGSKTSAKVWSLYGVRMSEKFFKSITTFSSSTNVPANIPLWAAFFYRLELVDMKTLRLFIDEGNLWNTVIPTAWLIHSFGITNDIFQDRISFLHGSNKDVFFDNNFFNTKTDLERLLLVVKSEEQDALEAKTLNLINENEHV